MTRRFYAGYITDTKSNIQSCPGQKYDNNDIQRYACSFITFLSLVFSINKFFDIKRKITQLINFMDFFKLFEDFPMKLKVYVPPNINNGGGRGIMMLEWGRRGGISPASNIKSCYLLLWLENRRNGRSIYYPPLNV